MSLNIFVKIIGYEKNNSMKTMNLESTKDDVNNFKSLLFDHPEIKSMNRKKDEMELIYSGRILSNKSNVKLSTYGISSGSTIYVSFRPPPSLDPSPSTSATADEKINDPSSITDYNIVLMMSNLVKAVKLASFESSVKKFMAMENINELSKKYNVPIDPISLVYLNKPELLLGYNKKEHFKNVMMKNTTIYFFLKKMLSSILSSNTVPVRNISYGLDDMMSDEDEEMDQSNNPAPITQEALAAALSAAQQNLQPPQNNSAQPSAPNPITLDMFRRAMTNTLNNQDQNTYPDQIAMMHQLGIMDDELSLRALRTTRGDLQAALDLIFSGWNE